MNKTEEIKQLHLFHLIEKIKKKLKSQENILKYFGEILKRIDDVVEKPLKLAVLGEFSSGKSTFLNRLLGIDILPTGFAPVTAAVTILEYGEVEKIEIVYKDSGENLVTKEYDGYDKLQIIQKQIIESSDFIDIKRIKVFVKNDILKCFNIIDTPGFNDPKNLGDKTKEIFTEINFVIWIFNSFQAGKGTEKENLNEFISKTLYKNNIYSLINFGDKIASSEDEYEKVATDITKNLNDNFPNYFSNQNILLISSYSQDKFWCDKFKKLEDDLKDQIIRKDKEISINQLKREVLNFREKLENINQSFIDILSYIEKEFEDFYQFFIEDQLVRKFEEIKPIIFDIIVNELESVIKEIKESKMISECNVESLIKFAAFYLTFEKLEVIIQKIQKIYSDYIDMFKNGILQFNDRLLQILGESKIKNDKIDNQVKINIQTLTSNLQLLSSTKRLLIIGYVIGLSSDDYIYNILKRYESVSDNLNRETVYNLLAIDFDISYFSEEIKDLIEKSQNTLRDSESLISDVLSDLKEIGG